MAKKPTVGTGIKKLVSKLVLGSPKRRASKPKQSLQVSTPKSLPSSSTSADTQVQQRIWGTSGTPFRQFVPLDTNGYQAKLDKAIASMTLGGKWNSIGNTTSNDLVKEQRYIKDVTQESTDIQNNFEVIGNQITYISNFLIRIDSKFQDFEKAIRKGLVTIASESVKNHITVVNNLNKQLGFIDRDVNKLTNKIETHDRQLDELYAHIKSKNRQSEVSSFLEKRKGNFQSSLATSSFNRQNNNEEDEQGGMDGSSSSSKYGIGAAAAAGAYAAGRGIRGANKLMQKGGFVAGKKIGQAIGGKALAKTMAKLGARFVPGLGWVLLGYEAYSFAKDYFGSKPEDSSEESFSAKNIDVKTTNPISLVSKQDISFESTRNISLKADKIIFDAREIEFKGNIRGVADTGIKPSGPASKPGEMPGGLFGWGGFPGSKPSSSSTPKGPGPQFSPNMGGGQGGIAPGGYSPSGGGFSPRGSPSSGGYSGRGGGGSSGGSTSSNSKAIAPRPQNALSALGSIGQPNNIPLNKNGEVDKAQYKAFLMSEIKKSGLDKLSPSDAKRFGIDGTPESWANFMMGLTEKESSFKPSVHGDRGSFGGHGSRGLFQLSPADAQSYKLQKNPFSYDQLHDPETNAAAAVKIAKTLVTNHGSISGGMGRYWGPIKRGNHIPYEKYQSIKAKKTGYVLPGMQKVIEKNDKNLDLIQSIRQKRLDKQGEMPELAGVKGVKGSFIHGYDPEKKYDFNYGNAKSDYINKNFLPGMNFIGSLGMGKAIGENPYIREGKFYEGGNAGVANVHKGPHHYGNLGVLASDISGGGYRPKFGKLVGGEAPAREMISALGDLMFHPEVRKILNPREMINQNRRINSGGYSTGGGHPSHVHFAPGRGTDKETFEKLTGLIMSNPDKFGAEGARFRDLAVKNGLWIPNKSGEGFRLNPSKFPELNLGAKGKFTEKIAKAMEVRNKQKVSVPVGARGLTAGMVKPKDVNRFSKTHANTPGNFGRAKNIMETKKLREISKQFRSPVQNEDLYKIKDMTDQIQPGRFNFGDMSDPRGMVVHSTVSARGATEKDIMRVFHERNFPANWIINRKGEIVKALPEGKMGQHVSSDSDKRRGREQNMDLTNENLEGIEVITGTGKDAHNYNPAQVAAVKRLLAMRAKKFGWDPARSIWPHVEINSHKGSEEGVSIVDDIRKNGIKKEFDEFSKISAKNTPQKSKVRSRMEKVSNLLANREQAIQKNRNFILPGKSVGNKRKAAAANTLASVKNKRNIINARPKQNVAQNGAISGGQRVTPKEEPKIVQEPAKKQQQTADASKAKPEASSGSSSGRSGGGSGGGYSSGGGGGSSPYNNSSDSIAPGPADDGYGDYKRCLI